MRQRDVVTELKFDKGSYTAEALAEAIQAHGSTLRKLDLGADNYYEHGPVENDSILLVAQHCTALTTLHLG